MIFTIILTFFLKRFIVIDWCKRFYWTIFRIWLHGIGGLIIFLFSNIGDSILRGERDVNRDMYLWQ